MLKFQIGEAEVEAAGQPSIHTGVVVGKNVRFGSNVTIWNFVVIQDNVTVGNNVTIGSFTDIGKNVKIGDNTQIQAHCTISNECIVGNDVFIGPNTSLLNDRYPHSHKLRPVIIQDKAVISGGVIICPDVYVGEGAFIAAAAVPTRDVPANTAVKTPGLPARPFSTRDQYDRKKMKYEAGPNAPHN